MHVCHRLICIHALHYAVVLPRAMSESVKKAEIIYNKQINDALYDLILINDETCIQCLPTLLIFLCPAVQFPPFPPI